MMDMSKSDKSTTSSVGCEFPMLLTERSCPDQKDWQILELCIQSFSLKASICSALGNGARSEHGVDMKEYHF